MSIVVKIAYSNCSKKGGTSLYFSFREWDLQKTFCLIMLIGENKIGYLSLLYSVAELRFELE